MKPGALWIVLGALISASGVIGYSIKGSDAEIVKQPVPGPTATVIKKKRVEVQSPPEFSLVPLRTPLAVPAPKGEAPPRRFLVPRGAKLEEIDWIPSTAWVPPQIVVTWRRGWDPIEAVGLLLWQFQKPGQKRDRWEVVYGVQEVELGCRASESSSDRYYKRRFLQVSCLEHDGAVVGAPGHEKTEKLVCGYVSGGIIFSLHDLTGDGHNDVFMSEGGCGSGFGTVWRVVASSPSGTEQVFRRATADTILQSVDGTIRVREAVYQKNDSHCCPSFFRKTVLVWDGERFVRNSRTLVPAEY